MFISTIIPTIGRSSLNKAVNSVLEQELIQADFEIIVINDSGKPLPEANWQNSPKVQIFHTNQRERSIARNVGAAVAKGNFLHFLDDDDWILPESFNAFWDLASKRESAFYFGGYKFVDSEGNEIETCHPNESGNCLIRFMSGEWQPLQASLVDTRIFHKLGGFLPLEKLKGGDEDVDLTRRLSINYDIQGIENLVAVIRLSVIDSTTDYSNLQEQSRQSREFILNESGVFSRMRKSAKERNDTAYWLGRIVWIYLGSVLWNFSQKQFLIILSRIFFTCASILTSFKYWFSQNFWTGALKPHLTSGWLVKENLKGKISGLD